MATTENNGQTTSKEYPLIPAGIYKAKPVEHAMTETKSGKAQFAIRFQILEGPEAGKFTAWWGGFDGKGLGYTSKSLATMGWDMKSHIAQFVPKGEVQLVVEHATLQAVPATPTSPAKPARTIARVKYINSLDGSGQNALSKNALSPEKKKSAGDEIMARLAAGEGAGADTGSIGSGNVEENTFKTTVDEGDIPF